MKKLLLAFALLAGAVNLSLGAMGSQTGSFGSVGAGGGSSSVGTNVLTSMVNAITPYTNNYTFPVMVAGGSAVVVRTAVAGVDTFESILVTNGVATTNALVVVN